MDMDMDMYFLKACFLKPYFLKVYWVGFDWVRSTSYILHRKAFHLKIQHYLDLFYPWL